jgi:hypothetical protein
VQPDLALDGDSLNWADRVGNKDLDRPVPAVMRGTYDYKYGGNGTWSFNTAYASSLWFDASVERFGLLEEVERYEGVGLPIVASIAGEEERTLRDAENLIGGSPVGDPGFDLR